MKINKELTPEERVIYVYEKEGQEMALARIGEKTFIAEIVRIEGVLTDEEWEKRKDNLVDRCVMSLSFFEQYGKSYNHKKDQNTNPPKKQVYPVMRLPYEKAQIRNT